MTWNDQETKADPTFRFGAQRGDKLQAAGDLLPSESSSAAESRSHQPPAVGPSVLNNEAF